MIFIKKIVAITGKGGAGKTTISTNLAYALLKLNRDVLLIDANLSNPHVGLHLGSLKHEVNLNHVLLNKNHISESVHTHDTGLRVIPSSLSLNHKCDIKGLKNHLNNLQSNIILLDSASGLSDEAVSTIKLADEVLLIANPDPTSLTDAVRTIRFSRKLGKNVTGLVLNKIQYPLDIERIEKFVETKVIGEIPEDDNIRRSIHLGEPVLHYDKNTKASLAINKLACYLTGNEFKEGFSFNNFFNKVLGKGNI